MDAKLQRITNRINALIPKEQDVQSAMRSQVDRIKNRALSGQDVDGKQFLPKRDGSQSTLTRTGLLLRSLQAGAGQGLEGLVGRISVTGRAREYAQYVNAKRRFMGVSSSDKTDVVNSLRQSLRERRSEQ